MIKNKLTKNDVKNNILIILRLLKPLVFKTDNSSLFIKSKKKNWAVSKKIKGKTWKSIDGVFNKVIKTGKKNPRSEFLKKEISSNILVIIIN